MIQMYIEENFPNLRNTPYQITSPHTALYNCIAWAANDQTKWWWPDIFGMAYWPPGVPRIETLEAFVQAYETIGYEICSQSSHETGYEKVAIYIDSEGKPTHAARQLPNGFWTSKLGQGHDISHTLQGVEGKTYGTVGQILKRKI